MNTTIRRALFATALIAVFALGVTLGANKFAQPKSIVHIVTVKWKADSTPEQQQKAIDGVKTMAAAINGVTNVWLKTVKVQGEGYNAVFAMEFANQAAFDSYAKHPAHAEWEKLYLPIRDRSTTHDVSN
jgi:Stress responsive A/B Barrel Domain